MESSLGMIFRNRVFKLCLVFFVAIHFQTGAQTLSEIFPLKGLGYDQVYASARDARGNTYVSVLIGLAGGAMNIQDSTYSYTTPYGGLTLVIKYNPEGTVEWFKD